MGIISYARSLFSGRLDLDGYAGMSSVWMRAPRLDHQAEAGPIWCNSIVAIAVKWLGDRFPRPRLVVYKIDRAGKWKPIPDNDVIKLWIKPNPDYSRRALEKAIGLSLVVDGNAFVHKVYDGKGKISELWWIPHQLVRPWYEDRVFRGWKVMAGGAEQEIPREEMIHIRDGIDPYVTRLGMSAVKAQLREICIVNEEGAFTYSILHNAGVTGLILSPKDNEFARMVKKEDADDIKERMKDATGGSKRGSTVVLKGPWDVKSVGFSPEQLAIKELPRNALARIAAATGVANMSMNLPDPDKTYANLEAANKASWGTVCAIQELIAEGIRDNLFPEFGLDPLTFNVGYDYSEIQELQESEDAIHKRAREDWLGSITTQNEARELLGLPADPDGDRYYFEIQTSIALARNPQQTLAAVEEEAASQTASPSANGTAGKRWEY
jgi:HK97 family phage portal protein